MDWPCPLCAGDSARQFQAHGHWIRKCGACRHEFAELASAHGHTDRTYGDAYFTGGGAGYDDYLSEAQLLEDRGRRYAGLIARHAPAGRMLDVGAAAGYVLRGFIHHGWRGVGIEPNATMAAHGRGLGLDLRHGTLESFADGDGFHLVSMIQVAAHFVDPMAAFAAAAGMTLPGGLWLVETWNRESLTRRVFGERWHEYSPPSVLHWFSPDGLAGAVARFGMKRIDQGRPAKWLLSGHAASLVRHKLEGTAVAPLGRWIARVAPPRVPIPYPAEDLFWMLFRKDAPTTGAGPRSA